MSLIKFKNGFGEMADAKLVETTRVAMTHLSGNTYFPTTDPAMADIQVKLNNFSDLVITAKYGDRIKIAEKNQAKQELVNTLHLLTAYLAYASKGNLLAAQTTGLPLVKSTSPQPPLSKPQNTRAENGDQSGVVKTSVDRVPGAVSYMHQYTSDPQMKEETWQSMNCSQCKCLITSLEPGKTYYFRIAAVGRKEQVMYSDVVSRIAV